jgi:Electron transfer DM13
MTTTNTNKNRTDTRKMSTAAFLLTAIAFISSSALASVDSINVFAAAPSNSSSSMTSINQTPIFTSSTVNESLATSTVDATGAKSYSGNFTGAGDGIHNAAGTAKVVALGDGSKILRLENFRSTNGPNVHVYLSTDKRPSDYVDLGKIKANNGNQNYNIPNGTDLNKDRFVLIWCKDFSVLFGSAELRI